jgi:hypothetical protein
MVSEKGKNIAHRNREGVFFSEYRLKVNVYFFLGPKQAARMDGRAGTGKGFEGIHN